MVLPNSDIVRKAFWDRYFSENKTYDGAGDAFRWWINPHLECAQQKAPTKQEKRCKAPCEFCVNQFARQFVRS